MDLALLLTLGLELGAATADAVRTTIAHYTAHPLPTSWPSPPDDCKDRFAEMARQTGLEPPELGPCQTRLSQ